MNIVQISIGEPTFEELRCMESVESYAKSVGAQYVLLTELPEHLRDYETIIGCNHLRFEYCSAIDGPVMYVDRDIMLDLEAFSLPEGVEYIADERHPDALFFMNNGKKYAGAIMNDYREYADKVSTAHMEISRFWKIITRNQHHDYCVFDSNSYQHLHRSRWKI